MLLVPRPQAIATQLYQCILIVIILTLAETHIYILFIYIYISTLYDFISTSMYQYMVTTVQNTSQYDILHIYVYRFTWWYSKYGSDTYLLCTSSIVRGMNGQNEFP